MEDPVPRGIYKIRSRNLAVAVYSGAGAFTGIRIKFGARYLFTEYAPNTVRQWELLRMLPEGISTDEYVSFPDKPNRVLFYELERAEAEVWEDPPADWLSSRAKDVITALGAADEDMPPEDITLVIIDGAACVVRTDDRREPAQRTVLLKMDGLRAETWADDHWE